MSLVDEILVVRNSVPADSVDRAIIDYLLQNAVGRKNAKTWDEINAHISALGFHIRKEDFQQGLLKDTREADSYIGSSDRGSYAGYFLIADRADAEIVSDFIIRRVTTQQNRLQRLRDLVNEKFPI